MRLSLRHQHDWQRITTTYAPPRADAMNINGWGEAWYTVARLLERAAYGVTSVLYECRTCHQTRVVEMLGKQVDEP